MQLRLKIGVSIVAFLSFIVVKAQNTFPSGGNVGIGTINPSAPLHIIGGAGNTIQLQKTTNNLPAILFSGANYSSIIEAGDNFNLYTNGVSRFYVTSNGNVGIGTTSPTQYISGTERVLQIYNSNAASLNLQDNNSTWTLTNAAGLGFYNNGYKMFISNSGNVGVGTITPMTRLQVRLSPNINWNMTTGTNGLTASLRAFNDAANGFIIGEIEASTLSINSASGGNVLIGKTTQSNASYKLDVAGNIRANKLVVNTTGADYVFANRYKLRSLTEVENYIKQNRHLPGIEPAKKMQEEGVNVEEIQTKLLEKIEELTLYVIEQKKELDNIKRENTKTVKELNLKIEKQQKEISQLIKSNNR